MGSRSLAQQAGRGERYTLAPARLLRAALLAALLTCLAGCAQGAAEPAALATPGGQGGPSGIAGQVFAASDVAGRPDTPLAGQMVLAVPLAQAGAILGTGAQAPAAEELRFLKAAIAAADPAIVTAVSDSAGQYQLALAAGSYVVCLADSQQAPPSFPARTRGCGRADVPAGAARRIDVSSGFGEILLIER